MDWMCGCVWALLSALSACASLHWKFERKHCKARSFDHFPHLIPINLFLSLSELWTNYSIYVRFCCFVPSVFFDVTEDSISICFLKSAWKAHWITCAKELIKKTTKTRMKQKTGPKSTSKFMLNKHYNSCSHLWLSDALAFWFI